MSAPLMLCDASRAAPKAILELNRPSDGIVAADCPAHVGSFSDIAHRLFEALGQTSAATGNRVRVTRDQIPLLTVSLLARDVTAVLIDDAQRLTTAPTVHLIQLCLSAGATVTLATRRSPSEALQRAVHAWPHQQLTWTARRRAILAARADPTPGPEPVAPLTCFAQLPGDEFPHFLTACRSQLDAVAYDTVRTEFHRVRRRAEFELGAAPDAERVLAVLRRALYDATSTAHATLICRAVTAAAFPQRVLLTADAAQLHATLGSEPWFGARTRTDWHDLHLHRRPERAAVAVLAGLGLDTHTMTGLRVGDLASLIDTAPVPARPHLHRLRLHRAITGADDDDPLLTLADGRPVTARWVRETLLDLGRSATHAADRSARRPPTEPDHPWAARLGIRARIIT